MSSNLQGAHRIQIIHLLLGGDERLLQFLFHHKLSRLRCPVGELLNEARGLSRGDYLIVQTAIDLWSGDGGVRLSDLLDVWDDEIFLNFLIALAYKRELVEVREALQCCSL